MHGNGVMRLLGDQAWAICCQLATGTVEREQNAECRLQMADGRCDGTVP